MTTSDQQNDGDAKAIEQPIRWSDGYSLFTLYTRSTTERDRRQTDPVAATAADLAAAGYVPASELEAVRRELEAHQRQLGEALGMMHEPSQGPTWPATWEQLIQAARIAESYRQKFPLLEQEKQAAEATGGAWLKDGLRDAARSATPEMKARVAANPSGFLPTAELEPHDPLFEAERFILSCGPDEPGSSEAQRNAIMSIIDAIRKRTDAPSSALGQERGELEAVRLELEQAPSYRELHKRIANQRASLGRLQHAYDCRTREVEFLTSERRELNNLVRIHPDVANSPLVEAVKSALTTERARAEEAERRANRADEQQRFWFKAYEQRELWLKQSEEREAAANARAGRLEVALMGALGELEETRWNPNGDMRAWAATGDGLNHARVCEAMSTLRVALSAAPQASTEQGEAPVCVRCNDTHWVETERGREMCTACPVPCGKCRSRGPGGGGAYCKDPLCGCHCHARPAKTSPIPQAAQASGETWPDPLARKRPEPMGFISLSEFEPAQPKLCHMCGTDGPAVCPHLSPFMPAQPKPSEPLPDYVTRGELVAALRWTAECFEDKALLVIANRLEGK